MTPYRPSSDRVKAPSLNCFAMRNLTKKRACSTVLSEATKRQHESMIASQQKRV